MIPKRLREDGKEIRNSAVMHYFFLLFIVLPAVELVLLIQLGRLIGTPGTLLLIVATGVAGAWLARRQGTGVLARLQQQVGAGEMPANALLDGVMILVAGALLVTPGVITDVVGFLCLLPPTRALIRKAVTAWARRAIDTGRLHFHVTGYRTEDETHRSEPSSRTPPTTEKTRPEKTHRREVTVHDVSPEPPDS